jgi:hypothetical protein
MFHVMQQSLEADGSQVWGVGVGVGWEGMFLV